jgi:hypothetical protein
MYGIYVNLNSKFVHTYYIKRRYKITLTARISKQVKINCDMEKCLNGKDLSEQIVSQIEHSRMDIFDGFMHTGRYLNEKQGYGEVVTKDHLEKFLSNILNESHIFGLNCTKSDMEYD